MQAKVVVGDPKSELDPRIQEVIATMFDKGIATSQMKSMEVVKKENVAATKDIICLEVNCGYHRGGPAAHTFFGLASGKKVSIAPAQIPSGAEVFMQSSSHNRKIPNNSAILVVKKGETASIRWHSLKSDEDTVYLLDDGS
jgi:hypothetical protein